MRSEDDQWYTAFAMSAVQNKMFFVIIERGISAMVENCNSLKLGSFYEVKFVHNSSARPENRAQHLITQYRPIAPLAEAVVNTDEVGRPHVILTTTAKCIGMVNSKGQQVAKLYNDTFGNFIDLKNLVKDRNRIVEFEFKCTASPVDRYSSVFVPVRVLNYYDMPLEDANMPENLAEVVGIVCVEPNGSTYLWSKHLARDAYVDERNWPDGHNMSGFWVKAAVDKTTNRVVGALERITDIFPVREVGGVYEIWITFQNLGFSDDRNCRTFEHIDFPCIFDTRNKVEFAAHASYTGWLQHQRCRGNGFWFISNQQPMVTSRDNYERPASRASNRSSFQSTNSVNGDSQRWNDDSMNHGGQSSEPRQQSPNSSNSVRERPRTSSRVQTTSDDESEHGLHTLKEVAAALDDVSPGRRRNVGTSRKSDTNSRRIDSGSDEASDDDRERSLSNRNLSRDISSGTVQIRRLIQENNHFRLKAKQEAAAMKYFYTGMNLVRDLKSFDEHLHDVMRMHHSESLPLAAWLQRSSNSAGATEEENQALATRLQNLMDSVSSWLDDQSIRNSMRNYDPSEYERLCKMLQFQNQKKYPSLMQRQDYLKMRLAQCALLIEYFAEDAEVSEVMIAYNRTKYEQLRNFVKDIYASI